jgi:hypothetical protein
MMSNQKLNSRKVLIIGPCPEAHLSKAYLEEKRSKGYVVVSFSCSSLIFLHDMGFVPDFHTFIDPQSYCRASLKTGIEFINQISYIGHNHFTDFSSLLISNKKLFRTSSFGITDFLSNKKYTDLYKENPPFTSYDCFLGQEARMVNIDPPGINAGIDFSKKLYRFQNGKAETDKLTYFVLPLLLFFFKDLSNLKILGFGHFESQRYFGGTKSAYPKYKSAFKKILHLYKRSTFNGIPSLSIDKSSFYSELESLNNR